MDSVDLHAVLGEEGFRLLVDRFYAAVAEDPVLRPLYPGDDLSAAGERLRLFLIQYWGGPAEYNAMRGHPRLRMRHMPFAIGLRERNAWLQHMSDAVASMGLPEDASQPLLAYFESASLAMMNRP